MIKTGDVISYLEMCQAEGTNLQRGMNFKLRGGYSVILMSLRKSAPYADRIEDDGKILIYEGHDVARTRGVMDPKKYDQPEFNPTGTLTQNGLFYEAAKKLKENYEQEPERVKVYEKLHAGIWVFNGLFKLINAWKEPSDGRQVFKFRLELIENQKIAEQEASTDLEHERLIPSTVKLEVWKRDHGACVMCGSDDNLHFDHIIPYSKGGSSLVANNIQILCARHNLAKRDKIQ